MISTPEKVCGRTKGPKRHKETRWFNEEVSVAVNEKTFLVNGLKLGLVNHEKVQGEQTVCKNSITG